MIEIYAYDNADSLFGIFNAIVAVMGAADYQSAIAAVAAFGFIIAFFVYAFQPERLHGWKWLATAVLVYSCVFVPRMTVGIVDKTGNSPEKMVANVPLGLALFGGMTSQIGNTLTGLFETAFQTIPGPTALPAELAYQQNGLMFGNRVLRTTRNLVFQDPAFRTDLINFIHNCTMYDLIDGTVDPAVFSSSQDVWPLMSNPNPARFTPTTANGTSTVMPCTNAYLNLDGRMPGQINLLQGQIAGQLNPSLAIALANAAVPGQITSTYQRDQINTTLASASDIIRQNALLNAINDTSQITGQQINDTASMVLAVGRAQAVAQTNASWINYAKVAEEALPLIRNAIEAIIYALFPFVVLLLLLATGIQAIAALKSYLMVLMWIQLWPPIYAVLNFMGSLAAANQLAAAASTGAGATALSVHTASSIYSTAISTEAVVGYLVLAIPAIAWAALKGMETIGQAALTGVGGIQSALSGATGSATLGNMSLGNDTQDQVRVSPTSNSAAWESFQDRQGNTWSRNRDTGREAISFLQNHGFISHGIGAATTSTSEEQATRSIEAAQSDLISANQEVAASLTEGVMKGRSKLNTSRLGSGYSAAQVADMQSNVQQVRSIVKDLSMRTGKSESQVATVLFGSGIGMGANVSGSLRQKSGGGTTGGGAGEGTASTSGGLSGLLDASGRFTQGYSSGVGRDYADLTRNLTQEQAASLKSYAERYQHDENFLQALSVDERDGEEKGARLSQALSHMERATDSLSQAERFSKGLRFGGSREERIGVNTWDDPENTQQLLEFFNEYRGSPELAAVAAGNHLAQKGVLTRPTAYSDGAAARWGFDSVHRDFEASSSSARYNPSVTGSFASDRASVHASVPGRLSPTALRSQVDGALHGNAAAAGAAWEASSEGANHAQSKFNEVSGVVPSTPDGPDFKGVGNPDGALTTKRILGNDAADAAGRDIVQSGRNTVDAAEHLAGQAREAASAAASGVKKEGKAVADWVKGWLGR